MGWDEMESESFKRKEIAVRKLMEVCGAEEKDCWEIVDGIVASVTLSISAGFVGMAEDNAYVHGCDES